MLQYRTSDPPISAISQDEATYLNFPGIQRGAVWTLLDEKMYIDSLLRVFPTLSLMMMEDYSHERGTFFQVLDGRQRLTTIRRFLNNEFPTLTARQLAQRDDISVIEDAQGLRFAELPMHLQTRLMQYTVHLQITPTIDIQLRGSMLRRINTHIGFSKGELLATFAHKPNQIAEQVVKHPVWEHFTLAIKNYRGVQRERKQTYQAALYLIELERNQGYPTDLRIEQINRLAMGDYDGDLGETILHTIQNNLVAIDRLYAGSTVRSKSGIILLYQSIQRLRDEGIDPMSLEQGSLVPFLTTVRTDPEWDQLIKNMTYEKTQKDVWRNYHPVLLKQCLLARAS